MKEHSTNYFNTFIAVAEDSKASSAEEPPKRADEPTAAGIQFEIISQNPYRFTSDDVLFEVFARKNHLAEAEKTMARKEFFSKGQPCMRSSALIKRYGWGVHSDGEGRLALYALGSEEYRKMKNDKAMAHVTAMRNVRK